MAKRKELSIEIRSAIITLHKEGYSIRLIARKIHVSYKGVQNTIRRFNETGSLANRPRSGRPKCTTKQEDLTLKLISKRNRRLTAPEIRASLNMHRNKQVSLSTVKLRLKECGLFGRVAVRKPLLKPQNRRKRLEWAKKYQNFTIEDWKKVLWTDESKFEIFGNKRRVYVRRSVKEKMMPKCVVPTIKFGGGSIMVWGSFSLCGVGNICKIEGILNKEGYKTILSDYAIPSGLQLIGDNFIFQQDNDPKHRSKLCMDFLQSQQNEGILQIMEWPPQSPDLNPIELLWDQLDRNIRQTCPSSKEQLWNSLQNYWKEIPKDTLSKLIERMPRICKVVIKSKGGYFDEKKV